MGNVVLPAINDNIKLDPMLPFQNKINNSLENNVGISSNNHVSNTLEQSIQGKPYRSGANADYGLKCDPIMCVFESTNPVVDVLHQTIHKFVTQGDESDSETMSINDCSVSLQLGMNKRISSDLESQSVCSLEAYLNLFMSESNGREMDQVVLKGGTSVQKSDCPLVNIAMYDPGEW